MASTRAQKQIGKLLRGQQGYARDLEGCTDLPTDLDLAGHQIVSDRRPHLVGSNLTQSQEREIAYSLVHLRLGLHIELHHD